MENIPLEGVLCTVERTKKDTLHFFSLTYETLIKHTTGINVRKKLKLTHMPVQIDILC